MMMKDGSGSPVTAGMSRVHFLTEKRQLKTMEIIEQLSHSEKFEGHSNCNIVRMCLAEVGLDPSRMMCQDDGGCSVGFGIGEEGMTLAEINRFCDKAMQIASMIRSDV
jgi:hypothetical protein